MKENNSGLMAKIQSQKEISTTKDLYIQYGCGLCAPENWSNFDASPNLLLERLPIVGMFYAGIKFIDGTPKRMRFPETVQFGDIVKGLPIKGGIAKGVYASHVLEHLSLNDFRIALKNTIYILQPGGRFRLIVPDLKCLVERYINASERGAAIAFIKETGMGLVSRPQGLKGIIQAFFGSAHHLWMWDYNSMKLELENAGFIHVRPAYFNDSQDPTFTKVEEQARFLDALALECQKPL